jgi:hypothetical protein
MVPFKNEKQQPLPDAVSTCRQKYIEQQPLPWLTLYLSAGLDSIPCIVRSTLAPGGGGLVPVHIGHIQQL